MGLFDDAVPGGSIAKPVMIALGALLAGKMMGGFGQAEPSRQAPPGVAGSGGPGGMVGSGLQWLMDRLKSGGLGDVANSWINPGPNQPVPPAQLGTALGQTTVAELARHAGISEQELLAQLSHVLPNVVDKLTPQGRVPNQSEIASHF